MTRFGIKPGLERIEILLRLMGDPETAYPSIHIAGTNGKGSVSAIISRVLMEAGYRIGIFTSPHLHSYCERIRIGQDMIDGQRLQELVSLLEPAVNECIAMDLGQPTEFEMLTAAAFMHFKQQGVDIAVMEAGLGGIYDSTNVLKDPLVTVITNVQMDHEAYLGSSLKEIALNKVGIAKPGVPLVCGDQQPEVLNLIREEVEKRGGRFFKASQIVELINPINLGTDGFTVDYKMDDSPKVSARFSLVGSYQLENLTTALAVLKMLKDRGILLSDEMVRKGLGKVRWPGRLEKVNDQPVVIMDAAHNPHGAHGLSRALSEIYPGQSRVVVAGVVDDKNGPDIFRELVDGTRLCIITRPEGDRGNKWLQKVREAKSVFAETIAVEQIEKAVDLAVKLARPHEYVLVTGSFFTLDRARRMFTLTY